MCLIGQTEDGDQKTDDGDQKTEDRGQKAEDRGIGFRNVDMECKRWNGECGGQRTDFGECGMRLDILLFRSSLFNPGSVFGASDHLFSVICPLSSVIYENHAA